MFKLDFEFQIFTVLSTPPYELKETNYTKNMQIE